MQQIGIFNILKGLTYKDGFSCGMDDFGPCPNAQCTQMDNYINWERIHYGLHISLAVNNVPYMELET